MRKPYHPQEWPQSSTLPGLAAGLGTVFHVQRQISPCCFQYSWKTDEKRARSTDSRRSRIKKFHLQDIFYPSLGRRTGLKESPLDRQARVKNKKCSPRRYFLDVRDVWESVMRIGIRSGLHRLNNLTSWKRWIPWLELFKRNTRKNHFIVL